MNQYGPVINQPANIHNHPQNHPSEGVFSSLSCNTKNNYHKTQDLRNKIFSICQKLETKISDCIISDFDSQGGLELISKQDVGAFIIVPSSSFPGFVEIIVKTKDTVETVRLVQQFPEINNKKQAKYLVTAPTDEIYYTIGLQAAQNDNQKIYQLKDLIRIINNSKEQLRNPSGGLVKSIALKFRVMNKKNAISYQKKLEKRQDFESFDLAQKQLIASQAMHHKFSYDSACKLLKSYPINSWLIRESPTLSTPRIVIKLREEGKEEYMDFPAYTQEVNEGKRSLTMDELNMKFKENNRMDPISYTTNEKRLIE